MRLLAAITLIIGALVLSSAASTAGAARGEAHRPLGLLPHAAHTIRFAPARPAKRTAGFNCISSCSSYESTINQYFTDVAAAGVAAATDNVYSVATQYSGIQYSETFGGTYVDGSPYPTTKTGACEDGVDKYCLTDTQLTKEIGKVIAANHWPTQSPTALYFVFTPANVGVCFNSGKPDINTNPCTSNAFCAYHGATASFIYAVEPDDAAVSQEACNTLQSPAGNGADSTISTISHEQMEAITDPKNDGWISEDSETYNGIAQAFYGSEIGDLCAWNFGAASGQPGVQYNQTINGHNYFLQQEWSNADGGCVQHLGGTPTNFDSSNPLYAGVGPLVFQNGSVMTTNTVYAIYWVPAAPANTLVPRIVGVPKVGHRLKALHGIWTYSPAFAYRWLRCSASGTSCTGIKNATAASYSIVPADAGHRLEVRVTARNAGGRAEASSSPTGKVRS